MKKLGWGLAFGALLGLAAYESRKKADGFVKKCKYALRKKIDSVLD